MTTGPKVRRAPAPGRGPGPAASGKPSTPSAPRSHGRGPASRAGGPASRGGAAPPPHEVRIVGGTLKRSRLPVADRPGLRPTPDRVRETLFNWLGQDLTGWRVLDAFAGSGALGFEAASRGAAEVVLLENDPALVRSLRASRERLRVGAMRVETADALAWMARCEPDRFDLVLLDPPFDSPLAAPALAAARRITVPDGYLYLEAPRRLDVVPPGLAMHRHARAGAVHFHLLRRTTLDPTDLRSPV